MNNKLLKPVTYIGTGILTFIFMALDYFKMVASSSITNEKQTMISGDAFDFMDLDTTGLNGEILQQIASIALVGVIIAAIVVILVGIAKLLPAVGVNVDALEAKATLIDKVAAGATKALVLLNVVAVVCTVAYGAVALAEMNAQFAGYGKVTLTPVIGAYLMLVIAVVAVFVEKAANKKAAAAVAEEAPAEEAPAEEN